MSTVKNATLALITAIVIVSGATVFAGDSEARVGHVHKRKPHSNPSASVNASVIPQSESPPGKGVVGYFGPPPFYGYGYGYGVPRGDVGYGLLGVLNGGGLRAYVECSNYYARYPGACAFEAVLRALVFRRVQ